MDGHWDVREPMQPRLAAAEKPELLEFPAFGAGTWQQSLRFLGQVRPQARGNLPVGDGDED